MKLFFEKIIVIAILCIAIHVNVSEYKFNCILHLIYQMRRKVI
jgi:hypothetical protein